LPQSEMIFPLAHGSEYAQFTDTTFAGVGQAALLQVVDNFRLGAAQKRVGGLFQRDCGGQGGLVCRAQLLGGSYTLFHGGVVRFACQRETQVGGGIFVGAVYAGRVGKLCEALQGMEQLSGGTLEIPAAARSEQHVSAKYDSRRDKRDVIVDVPGNFDDVELGANPFQL